MNERKLIIDMLDTDSANEALEIVGNCADANEIDWALCGGIALQVYGSPRLTKDIDFIASKNLPLQASRQLSFGGERYEIQTSKKIVAVDWIKRFDDWKDLYQAALQDAIVVNNVPIITPEWLVILKYCAGRFKDQEDAVFLLREKGLVNRRLLKEDFVKVRGRQEWGRFFGFLSRWFDLADKFVRDGDENESYRTEDEYLDS